MRIFTSYFEVKKLSLFLEEEGGGKYLGIV